MICDVCQGTTHRLMRRGGVWVCRVCDHTPPVSAPWVREKYCDRTDGKGIITRAERNHFIREGNYIERVVDGRGNVQTFPISAREAGRVTIPMGR